MYDRRYPFSVGEYASELPGAGALRLVPVLLAQGDSFIARPGSDLVLALAETEDDGNCIVDILPTKPHERPGDGFIFEEGPRVRMLYALRDLLVAEMSIAACRAFMQRSEWFRDAFFRARTARIEFLRGGRGFTGQFIPLLGETPPGYLH